MTTMLILIAISALLIGRDWLLQKHYKRRFEEVLTFNEDLMAQREYDWCVPRPPLTTVGQLLDLRKWTYRQFYPREVGE